MENNNYKDIFTEDNTITITEFRKNIQKYFDKVNNCKQMLITKYEKPDMVLMDYKEYVRIMNLVKYVKENKLDLKSDL